MDPSLYIIDSTGHIKVKGVQGAQGIMGIPGEEGPQGEQGQIGAIGQIGPVGPVGPQGIPGFATIEEPSNEDQIWVPPTPLNPSQLTVTSTGSITTLNPGTSFILLNNSTLVSINGLAAGFPGQVITFVSIGTGQVDFLNQAISSPNGTKFSNTVVSLNTSLAAGRGYVTYQYDTANSVWRLVNHEQGAAIPYSPSWHASVTNPTIGNGTLSGSYYLRGSNVIIIVNITAGSTTTFGSGFWVIGTPGLISNISPTGLSSAFTGIAIDVVGGANHGLIAAYTSAVSGGLFASDTSTNSNVDSTHPFAWANTDILRISAEFAIA